MKIKNEKGIKRVSCDNLEELITEFKKFRNSKSADERKSYSFNGWGGFLSMLAFRTIKRPDGKFSVSEIIDSVKVYQENGIDLSLNVALLNFREADWEPYHQKVKKILKEIWETGEVKDYQGLDLNWPAASSRIVTFCDQCHKYIGEDRKKAHFSDAEKNLDFCSESCYSKFKVNNNLEKENKNLKEQLRKTTENKTIWMTISIAVVSVFASYLLFSWLKNKRVKKR